MFISVQNEADSESDSEKEVKDYTMMSKESRNVFNVPVISTLEIPFSTQEVISRISQAQLSRAKKDIDMQLNDIMNNVKRIINRYSIDQNLSSPRKPSIIEYNKKRRPNLMEKIATFSNTLEVREKILAQILAWLEEWNSILSEITTTDIEERSHWIAQMEILPVTFKAIESNVKILTKISTSLLEDKKKQKKKITSRGTLWKPWKERVTKRPATAHALRPDQMISDEFATNTKVSEIQDMLQELVSSSMFSKMENNAIKYISSTIINLSKALTMVNEELKISLQNANILIKETDDAEKDLSLNIIEDLSEKNEMLQQQLQTAEEKCEHLIRSKDFLEQQLQALTASSLKMMTKLSPQSSMSIIKVDDIEDHIDSILAKELENMVDEAQRKGARSPGIKKDTTVSHAVLDEMTADLNEQKVATAKTSHHPEPQALGKKGRERKSSSEAKSKSTTESKKQHTAPALLSPEMRQSDRSVASILWEGPEIKSEYPSDRRQISSEMIAESTIESKDKESKRKMGSLREPSRHKQFEKMKEIQKHHVSPEATKRKEAKTEKGKSSFTKHVKPHELAKSRTAEETSESTSIIDKSEQGNLEEFQKAIMAFLKEKIDNVGKPFDKKFVLSEELLLKRAEAKKLGIIKAKLEEYFQKVAEITTKILRKYRDKKMAGQVGEKPKQSKKVAVLTLGSQTQKPSTSAKTEITTFLLHENLDPIISNLIQMILTEVESERDVLEVSTLRRDHKEKEEQRQGEYLQGSRKISGHQLLGEKNLWKGSQEIVKNNLEKERTWLQMKEEKQLQQKPWQEKELWKEQQKQWLEQEEKQKQSKEEDEEQQRREAGEPKMKGALLEEVKWMRQLQEEVRQLELTRRWEKEEEKQKLGRKVEDHERKKQKIATNQVMIKEKKPEDLEKIISKTLVLSSDSIHPPSQKSMLKDASQLYPRKEIHRNLKSFEALHGELPISITPPTKSITLTPEEAQALGVTLTPEEAQALGVTLPPQQAQAQVITLTPQQAQTLGVTLTPQQAQALGITLTPEEAQAQGVTLTPEEAQALGITLPPQQAQTLGVTLTPQQAQALGITLPPQQAQTLGVTLTPQQAQALGVTLTPQQAQTQGVTLTPQQAQALGITLPPQQAQTLGVTLTPQQAQALGVTLTPQQAQALGVTLTPEEAQALGITLTPQQAQAQGVTLTPQQAQILGVTLTPQQAQTLGVTLTPEEAQAQGVTLPPQQAQAQGVTLPPQQAQALGVTLPPQWAQALGVTLPPQWAQAQGLTLTPEEAQALGITLTPEEAQAQVITLTPEEAQAQGVTLTPEEAQALGITLPPQQAQALGITLPTQQAQAQGVTLTPEEAQALGITLPPQQAQALGVTLTPREAQEEGVILSPQQAQARGIILTPQQAQTRGVTLTPQQAQALQVTLTPQQVKALGIKVTPEKAQVQGITLTSQQAQALRAVLNLKQAPKLQIPFTPKQAQALKPLTLEQAQILRVPITPKQTQTLKTSLTSEQVHAMQIPPTEEPDQRFRAPITHGQVQTERITLTPQQTQALGITLTPEQVYGLGLPLTPEQAQSQWVPFSSEQAQALQVPLTKEQADKLGVPVTPENVQAIPKTLILKQTHGLEVTPSPKQAQETGVSLTSEAPLSIRQAQELGVPSSPESARVSAVTPTLKQAQTLGPPLTLAQAQVLGVPLTPEQFRKLGVPVTLDKAHVLGSPLTPEQVQSLGVPITLGQAQPVDITLMPKQDLKSRAPFTGEQPSQLWTGPPSERTPELGISSVTDQSFTPSAPHIPKQFPTLAPSTLRPFQELEASLFPEQSFTSRFSPSSRQLLASSPISETCSTFGVSPLQIPTSSLTQSPFSLGTSPVMGIASDPEKLLAPQTLPSSRGPPTPRHLLAPEIPPTPSQLFISKGPLTPESPLILKSSLTPRQPLLPGVSPTSGQIPSLSLGQPLVSGTSSIPGKLLESRPFTLPEQPQVSQTPLWGPSTLGQDLAPWILPGQPSPLWVPPTPEKPPTLWALPTPGKPQKDLTSAVSKKRKEGLEVISSLKSAFVPPSAPKFKAQAPLTTKKRQTSEVSGTSEETQMLRDPFAMEQSRTVQPYLTDYTRTPISQTPYIDEEALSTLVKPLTPLPSLVTQQLKTSEASLSEWDQKSRFPPIDKSWILTSVSAIKRPKMIVPPSSPQELEEEEKKYFVDVEAQRKNLVLLSQATKISGFPSQLHATARKLIIETLHTDTVRLGYLFRKYIAYRLIQRARNNIIKRLQAIQNTGKGYETRNLYIILSRIDDYQKKVMQVWTEKQTSLEQKRNQCLRKMMYLFSQLQEMYKLNLSLPIPLIINEKQIFASTKFVHHPLLELLIEENRKFDTFRKFRKQRDHIEAIWNADLSTSSYPIIEKKSLHSLWDQLGGYPDIPRLLQLDVQSTFRKSLASIQSQFKKIPK